MVKLKLTSPVNGQTLILIGLSAGNLRELRKGRPIVAPCADFGIPVDGELAIMFGETEQAIVAWLRREGVLPPEGDTDA